jgi:hypothetical protein
MTVYTAIFGTYDYLKPLKRNQKGEWKFICYTDQPDDSEIFDLVKVNPAPWEIRRVPVMEFGPAKTARWYKINFHKHIEDDFSIWIDGTFFINCDLSRWVRKRFVADFTVIKHPFDDCAYIDAHSCLKLGRGNWMDIVRQVNHYKNEGLPEHNGLISSGILMRNNTKQVQKICDDWWQQVEQFSERDQIGFAYAAWKNPGLVHVTEWNYTIQNEFQHCPHRHKAWSDKKAKQLAGM